MSDPSINKNYNPIWKSLDGIKKIFAIVGPIKKITYRWLFDKNYTRLRDKDNKVLNAIRNRDYENLE